MALFTCFGAVLGLWLSVVGIAVTAVGVLVLCAVIGSLLGSPFTWQQMIGAMVFLQVGYFCTIAARSMLGHYRLTRAGAQRESPMRSAKPHPNLPAD